MVNEPIIESHGCVYADGETEEDLRLVALRAVENYDYANGDKTDLALTIRKTLKNYFYKKTKQAPLIVVSILEL